MPQYKKPIIQILNKDNLVYRNKPYVLKFKITKPELLEDVTSSFAIKKTNDKESNFHLDKRKWSFDINKKININKIQYMGLNEENEDILDITGKIKPEYLYKIFLNNSLIKELSSSIQDNIEDNIKITASYFNNFVDGNIEIKVFYGFHNNLIETESINYNLQLINTAPTIFIGDIVNNKMNLTITDSEKDAISINIKLNGYNYFPENGGFTKLRTVPYFYTTDFDSEFLNINPEDFTTTNNVVTITIKDKYGAETQINKAFIGNYYGVMFLDENGDFLSDDSNIYKDDANILKEAYLGNVKAGTKSEKKLVKIKNNTNQTLGNIKLILNTVGIPEKTEVKISESNLVDFKEMTNIVDFKEKILQPNQTIPFYIQCNTDILSLGGGYFYIDIIADSIIM